MRQQHMLKKHIIDSPSINLGLRYMTNTKFGFKIGGQYNQYKSESGVAASKEFDTRLMAINVEGFVNMGRALQFEEWAKRFNLMIPMLN